MSRERREVQQHLPFTAAFALIQALRDPSGAWNRDAEDSHETYHPVESSDLLTSDVQGLA